MPHHSSTPDSVGFPTPGNPESGAMGELGGAGDREWGSGLSEGYVALADAAERAEPISHALREAVRARGARALWRAVTLGERLTMVERFRGRVASDILGTLGRFMPEEPLAKHEWLVSQVGPLLDACRFLETKAARILRERACDWFGAPLSWMSLRSRVFREPWGTVLVLAPSNYPLFLPAVQVIQALVAGNTVLWKPAAGDQTLAGGIRDLLIEAGLPSEVLRILPSDVSSFEQSLAAGVDKVFLTGHHETGRSVLRALSRRLIPATMELSGVDGCLVCGDADLAKVARAVAFGMHWNDGRTCMAPRRVWLPRGVTDSFLQHLTQFLNERGTFGSAPALSMDLRMCILNAQQQGARLAWGNLGSEGATPPWILRDVKPSMPLLSREWFVPLLCVGEVDSDEAGVVAVNSSPYALGASIFSGNIARARTLASRIQAGVVVINDLIAPTADPRLPFGGGGRSGFGVTRGVEGLLEMTRPKVVTEQRLANPPYHQCPREGDSELMIAWFKALHAPQWGKRFEALRELVALARRRSVAGLLRRNRAAMKAESPADRLELEGDRKK